MFFKGWMLSSHCVENFAFCTHDNADKFLLHMMINILFFVQIPKPISSNSSEC
uniref:Uncharacterized protein n=1 Tax=Arundo donax TaxID=35708 RepID=A0A0A9HEM8_ARUDO